MLIIRLREMVRSLVITSRYFVMCKVYGMGIDPTARISVERNWTARIREGSISVRNPMSPQARSSSRTTSAVR